MICLCVCMHACVCLCVLVCVQKRVCAGACVCIRVSICVCLCACAYDCARVCGCVYGCVCGCVCGCVWVVRLRPEPWAGGHPAVGRTAGKRPRMGWRCLLWPRCVSGQRRPRPKAATGLGWPQPGHSHTQWGGHRFPLEIVTPRGRLQALFKDPPRGGQGRVTPTLPLGAGPPEKLGHLRAVPIFSEFLTKLHTWTSKNFGPKCHINGRGVTSTGVASNPAFSWKLLFGNQESRRQQAKRGPYPTGEWHHSLF